MAHTHATSTSFAAVTKLHFPQPWLDQMEGSTFIEQIEVRKVPNSSDDEFFFGGLPYGDNNYAHEVDKNMLAPQYAKNKFSVNFSGGPRARTATRQEWESGSRIATRPMLLMHKGTDDSSGEIEYKQKRYSKVGKYWGQGRLSPSGRWLAIFSYSGEKQPPDLFGFLGGANPREGDIFWQIYDTVSGKKVFEWEAKNVKGPTNFSGPVVWLEDRYFLFPEDREAQNFIVVNLPPYTPEENPVTMQLPSRRDATGRPLPAGASDEAWIPIAPLTKEQAAKLTAASDTEISAVRLSAGPWPKELLLAIHEETENRRIRRQQRDGSGEYHYRLISTYYYALTLDNPTQTRVASKEEWDRGQTVRTDRPSGPAGTEDETVVGTLPPYRQFPKTGMSWGSPPTLSAGEWIAIFSYNKDAQETRSAGKIFVAIYDQRLGHKLLSTALPITASPNELFKGAVWIEGGYILLPLNSSLDSFAFWQLP